MSQRQDIGPGVSGIAAWALKFSPSLWLRSWLLYLGIQTHVGSTMQPEMKPLQNICEYLHALHIYTDEARRGEVRTVRSETVQPPRRLSIADLETGLRVSLLLSCWERSAHIKTCKAGWILLNFIRPASMPHLRLMQAGCETDWRRVHDSKRAILETRP
jgi:hypothetical protein